MLTCFYMCCVLCGVLFVTGLIGPGDSLTGAYGLVGLNLLLPLAVTVLRGMIASLNPLSKYSVLKGTVFLSSYPI